MSAPITQNNQFGQSPTLQQQFIDAKTRTPAQQRALYESRVLAQGYKDVAHYERVRDQQWKERAKEDAREDARGKEQQKVFEFEREQNRQIRERSERNRNSPFRPINDLLVKAGDLAVKMGGAGLIGELYKKVAPPSSEFYRKGTLEQKLTG